jgi:predicted RNA-binding Zn-ribbon protein involved in translation (DUF1610 family)
MSVEIKVTFDCPHCGQGYEIGDDAIYTDDIEDECASQCPECGRYYQLRCVDVVVKMEATKAVKEGADQSDD